ncbi:MAG: terminase small subunit [Candidatus Hydrogenedentes bacterium]|nr:terminase small subunit [Candidatus Hydrogenedentota bacterium]
MTQKQYKFVLEYLRTGNRVEAYRRTYDCRNMNPRTIARKAQEVAANPKVRNLLEEKRHAHFERYQVELDNTLRNLLAIAFTNLTDFYDFDGKTLRGKDLRTVPEHKWAAIKSIRVNKKHVTITLHNKLSALKALGVHLGMFDGKQRQGRIQNSPIALVGDEHSIGRGTE